MSLGVVVATVSQLYFQGIAGKLGFVGDIDYVNADAIIAVYPFTPQPSITQAIISVSDVPVFVGVGGGITTGSRSVRLANKEYRRATGRFCHGVLFGACRNE